MDYHQKNLTSNNPRFFAIVLFITVLTIFGCASDLRPVWKSPGTAPSSAELWTPTHDTMSKSTSKSPRITMPEDII
ncbi:MAG TPA: hypothetical protein VLM43_13675, partial [Desulfobacterales bacterium]|nr:hypothetical protein [Desulfobacterales bacterium]